MPLPKPDRPMNQEPGFKSLGKCRFSPDGRKPPDWRLPVMTAMKKKKKKKRPGCADLVPRSTSRVKKNVKCLDICVGHAPRGPKFSQQHRPRLRQSRTKNGAQGRRKLLTNPPALAPKLQMCWFLTATFGSKRHQHVSVQRNAVYEHDSLKIQI